MSERLLLQHPDIAANLHDELTSVLKGDAPTIEQLAQLPLLERVIKESMRIINIGRFDQGINPLRCNRQFKVGNDISARIG